MTNMEIIKKLRIEIHELSEKITNLAVFLKTKKYSKLSSEQQTLLKKQHKHMSEYYLCLLLRIALIQDDIDNGVK